MMSNALSDGRIAHYTNNKEPTSMTHLKLIQIAEVLKSQSANTTTTQYSHLTKPSLRTERAKFDLFADSQANALLAAEKFRLSMEEANTHYDILSPQNIEKLLNKYHVNIPKKGFYCPHFNLWVGGKKKEDNKDKKISDEKFENVAIMVFHEWVINWLFVKKFVLSNPNIDLTEDDALLYGFEVINKEACYHAMLKYFGPFSVHCWTEAKKDYLRPENLLQELSIKAYRTPDTSIAVRKMMEEANEYLITKKIPRIRFKLYDMIGVKKTPPHLSRRKGCLDRIAERMDSSDVKEQYEMVKDLPRHSKFKLRKKGVDIPTKGELIASMSNEEFDAWCVENNIDRKKKSYYKTKYRDVK